MTKVILKKKKGKSRKKIEERRKKKCKKGTWKAEESYLSTLISVGNEVGRMVGCLGAGDGKCVLWKRV